MPSGLQFILLVFNNSVCLKPVHNGICLVSQTDFIYPPNTCLGRYQAGREVQLLWTTHTDPEHRLGFFECLTGSEELLAITACVQNIYKKN